MRQSRGALAAVGLIDHGWNPLISAFINLGLSQNEAPRMGGVALVVLETKVDTHNPCLCPSAGRPVEMAGGRWATRSSNPCVCVCVCFGR